MCVANRKTMVAISEICKTVPSLCVKISYIIHKMIVPFLLLFLQPFQWSSLREMSVEKRNISPCPKMLNITDLPFPGYFYNITVRPRAHYWGDAYFLQVQTGETGKFNNRHLYSFHCLVYCQTWWCTCVYTQFMYQMDWVCLILCSKLGVCV